MTVLRRFHVSPHTGTSVAVMDSQPKAYVEPPHGGWGPRQQLLTALERLGYRVDALGAGQTWILILR